MKNILYITLIILPVAIFGREPKDVLNESKLIVTELKKEKKREAMLIYNWLANTSETRIHQLRGATENVLYIHENGHYEAVFDGEGKIVRDGINDGSYNYAHPVEDPANHFTLDILPWIFWGYSREDPTSIEERIVAYSESLGSGLVSAQANHQDFKKKKLSKDEREAIAIFVRIIEAGDVSEVYEILSDPKYESKNPYAIGDGLTKGLMTVMLNK
ncbi:hypothetical protein [Coraliomargarita parva]|uniref:hypothetical protein n=1 Tax=Coraliomargarita parva TaxID=3014050 RepID=UPI0022B354BA|nr:hypothetical protein [Coraliomargarita parva]